MQGGCNSPEQKEQQQSISANKSPSSEKREIHIYPRQLYRMSKERKNIQHFADGKNIAQSYTVMRVVMAYNWHPEKDLPQSSLRIAALKRKSLSKLIMYQQIFFKTGRREIRINVLRNI